MKVNASSSFLGLRAVSTVSVRSGRSVANEAEAEDSNNPLAKLIKDWHEAQANARPTNRFNPRQAALEKAAMLKQQLEMLKAMLIFASPAMAKAIAQQLKGIASELAALGKSAGGGTAGNPTVSIGAQNTTPTEGEAASATAEASADVAAAPAAVDQPSSTSDAQQTDEGRENDVAGDKSGSDSAKAGESTQKSEDNALRRSIADAKRLLKELILRVKAKLREGDDDARRDLQAAEKSLANLDSETNPGLYTALGGVSLDVAGADLSLPSELTGASVDVSA